ncbi:hypothetical protein VE03_03051 [Pseudogymnoascus sp. 23342-1-I1]|nr:hypothetical protein VE03_03051 [Pseudogymnoascus sp. 23342-1-I1]
MKFLTLPLLSSLLALTTTTTASPIDVGSHGDASGATVSRTDVVAAIGGLSPRNTRTCTIVNVVTTVDCWYWPTHKKETQGSPPVKNHVVTSFKPNSKHDFVCYLPGQKVGGIT